MLRNINPILLVNSSFIITLTIILGYLIVSNIRLNKVSGYISNSVDKINEKNQDRKLLRELKRHTRTISIRMTLTEKVELYLIDKSNIRRFIPFMNFYILILSSLIIFAVSFIYVNEVLRFIPSTAMICFVFSLIPYYVLDIMGKYNSEIIRKKLSYFISVLLRWYAVKEDIFYAFEKSIASGIGQPLKSFIRDMLIQINKGMEPVEAMDMLQLKVDNQQFREFIINIKHCIKRKGDMFVLLNNLGDQFYKIEEEFNRRKISTYRDRITIVAVMAAVLLIAWYLLKTQPKIYQFYLGTVQGKMLMTLFTVLYAAGFYIFTRITKFKH